MKLTRRSALLGLSSAVALGPASLAWAEAATQRRFIVIILRGALDGLAAVVPHGDSALKGLRAELVADGLLDLGGFYGLHPALTGLHGMYRDGDLLLLHAVAGPYRVRSHFEAQDMLESGADHPMTSGWLNRAVGRLPPVAVKAETDAMAFGVEMPLLLRGPARAANWAPDRLAQASPDLYAQVARLASDDPVIGPALLEGMRERGYSDAVLSDQSPKGDGFMVLAKAAGEMLARADGPRVAALELDGWDTHVNQPRRLDAMLGRLDEGLAALREALGATWRDTAVLCMTEFGRTARVNGNHGTDHGTGTVAFLLGGAVAGGHVRADWPGLGRGRLLDDRDLRPTTDLRAVAKGILGAHFGLRGAALAAVFPNSGAVSPMRGLMRV